MIQDEKVRYRPGTRACDSCHHRKVLAYDYPVLGEEELRS